DRIRSDRILRDPRKLAALTATLRGTESAERGTLTGLGLDTGRGHLVRALVEGIAAQVVELAGAAATDRGAPLDSLRADGGLTRSALLMQTQADLLQLPVEVAALPDATALGVGAMARLGHEPGLTVPEAVPPWKPSAVYEPAISADEAADRMGRFRAEVTALLSRPPAPGGSPRTASAQPPGTPEGPA
ncbi:FGGY-family carbohydrate kinase, partial [Streptomyces sp. NPDC004779]